MVKLLRRWRARLIALQPLVQRDFSLRARFAAFTLTVCFAIVAVFVVDAIHERDVATSVARTAAENLAESLAQQASDTFDADSGALRSIAQQVRRKGMGDRARLDLRDTMAALTSAMPRIQLLAVFDERGRIIASNLSAHPVGLPTIADRAYFQYHRSEPTPGLTITGPIRGKMNQHRWELIVSQRLERPDGSFAGVAIAPISLLHFERSYAGVDVGRYGNITLFGRDGTILVRKPSLFIGERFPRAHLLVDTNVLAPSGWYITNARADGQAHLFTYRRLHRYPLIVRVGVAESEYLAAWRSDTRTKAFALVVVITLVGTLAAELNAQIGQRKRAEERLVRLAMHDGLTGLANRRQFDDVLEREWRYAARDQSPLALLMIDVDHFKSYNDLYGHQHGDATLVRVAQAIAADLMRPGDLAARYGGEEFVVILHGADLDSAFIVAERIRTAVAALGIVHRGTPPGVATVSIGIAATVPRRHVDPASLVEAADKALYLAKGGGRNRTASARVAFVDADVE